MLSGSANPDMVNAQHFGGMNGITLNHEAATTKNTYWMMTVLFSPELGLRKEDVIAQLRHRKSIPDPTPAPARCATPGKQGLLGKADEPRPHSGRFADSSTAAEWPD